MRIALANWTDRRAGGVETYVEQVVSALRDLGHDVACWHQTSLPADRAPMALPPGVARSVLTDGPSAVSDWRPDVVLLNGLQDPAIEEGLVAAAPTLVVAHNLNHTCISGTKSWSAPVATPCHRRFGWPCLAHYFPHRCGGLNPVTMATLYRRKHRLLALTRRAPGVVTLSRFVRDEYVRHGFDPARVVHVPFGPGCPASGGRVATASGLAGEPSRLLVLSRLERLKGVHLAIEALPLAARSLGRPLGLTVVGEGPEHTRLSSLAADVTRARPDISVNFSSWVSPEARDALLADTDLLVVPSILPEALGLVGLEAGALGVPAAAFDAGAVSEWLEDGRTGALARSDPPTALGLAAAIATCLADQGRLARMGEAARERAAASSPAAHARGLLEVMAGVAGAPSGGRG